MGITFLAIVSIVGTDLLAIYKNELYSDVSYYKLQVKGHYNKIYPHILEQIIKE